MKSAFIPYINMRPSYTILYSVSSIFGEKVIGNVLISVTCHVVTHFRYSLELSGKKAGFLEMSLSDRTRD